MISTLASGSFLFWVFMIIAVGFVCVAGRIVRSSSGESTFPCFEHSVQTVSLAPSMIALTGVSWILRPQTSHRIVHSPILFLFGWLCL